jgi:hypothetical protein
MSHANGFLNKDPDELESFLFAHARREIAPDAARARALLSVASVVVGVGVLSGAAAVGARPAVGKITTWLAAKWLLVGFGGGLVTLAAVQGVVQSTAPSDAEPLKNSSLALPLAQSKPSRPASAVPPQQEPSVVALPLESVAPPEPAATPSAVLVAAAPAVPGSASDHSASSPSDSASQLTRELALLDQARSALDERANARALQALDGYAKEFPNGSLSAEAAALRVQAVGFADPARALRLAQAFLTNYPGSPLVARVRALAVGYRANDRKP